MEALEDWLGPGKPNLPLGLRGKAGGGARVTRRDSRGERSPWLPLENTTLSGQGGAGVWSRGEGWAGRRMLQSAPALHPNQRCGGCAARPSIFHTKGRPPPPLRSPQRPPPMTAGQCRGAEKRETDTQTRTERPRKFKKGPASRLERRAESLASPRDEA